MIKKELCAALRRSGDQPESPVQAPEETAPAAEESLPAAETSVSSPVPSNPIPEVRPEESLAADVTSVQPGSGYRPWGAEHAEDNDNHFHPVFRQGWQARTASQRETPPRPAWQQQRPIGAANRFGPQASSSGVQSIGQQEERQESFQPRMPESAPRLTLSSGLTAAPQRPSYQNRR